MSFGDKFQFGSGLKKLNKKDPIVMSLLRVPPKLVGSVFIFGKIGTGKTVSMLSLAGLYHDHPQRQCKIIDIWGGDRNEHLYWGLPSNQKKYWTFTKKLLRLNKEGLKQYQVTYYYPLMKKLRKDLPFNPPYVTSKIFTIPIRDITHNDFALVIGKVGENSASLWKRVINESKKTDSASKIANNFRKNVSKVNAIYNSIIHPLVNEGFLQEDSCQFNFNEKEISKMLDDQETITVLSLDYVDEEYKLFVVGYLLRKICEALDKKRRNVLGIFREASKFFKVTDQSIVPDRYKVMKSYLSDWLRMGRRGFHPFLDTQSPCLDENTKIIANKKIQKIKDIPNEFKVNSYDFDTQTFKELDAKKIDTEVQDCYEIELSNGRKVIATKNHRFFNENGEISVKNLNVGDMIYAEKISEEIKKKFSNIAKKLWKNKDYREIQIKKHLNFKQSDETKKKRSEFFKKWHQENKNSYKYKLRTKRCRRSNKGTFEERYGIEKAKIVKDKMSKVFKGRKLSEEHKNNISKGNKGNLKLKRSLRKYFRENELSEDTKLKRSNATKKLWLNPEYRKKCSTSGWKMHWRARKKISDSQKTERNAMRRPEVIEKMRQFMINWWKECEHKNKWHDSLSNTKLNKKEKKVLKILKNNHLNFKFVGNAKKWITGHDNSRYNPDFIDEKNKKIIEFFGTFWHKERDNRDKARIIAYKNAGYDVLIIKEEDLDNNPEQVNKHIIQFAK